MGCHAALNRLRVAKAFGDAEPDARVLSCAVELCSLHHQYGWRPDRIVANSLLADGAAAVVAGGRSKSTHDWRLIASASAIFPDTEDAMRWQIRDHGFEMALSAKLPELIPPICVLGSTHGSQGLACRSARSAAGPFTPAGLACWRPSKKPAT